MSTQARFTLDEYDRMIDAAVFDPDRRIELIFGELREMSPIGDRHRHAVNALMNQWVMAQSTPDLRQRMIVQVQSPIRLPRQQSAPQPDMSWIGHDATPLGGDEVFLVIEVAESTLDFDRGEKAELYAAADIPDYWIVNLIDNCVEVHRDPQDGRYQSLQTYHAGDELRPLLFPECLLRVGLLFG
ncbi:MAG TPA: Uma2 family endonuclease [Pirellulales bacterium]|nr:Uma2 family endonuclease [Pirellulales bacterium]